MRRIGRRIQCNNARNMAVLAILIQSSTSFFSSSTLRTASKHSSSHTRVVRQAFKPGSGKGVSPSCPGGLLEGLQYERYECGFQKYWRLCGTL